MTRRLALVFLPALLILLVAGLFAWLLRTESGATWLWARVSSAVPELRAERVSGALRSGMSLTGLSYRGDGVTAEIDRLEFRVALDLVPLAVSVEAADAGQLQVHMRPGREPVPAAAPTEIATLLEALALPLPVEFEAVSVARLLIEGEDGAVLADFRNLSLAGRWHDGWLLDRFRLEYGDRLSAEGSANLVLQRPFPAGATVRIDVGERSGGENRTPQAFRIAVEGDLSRLGVDAERGGLRVSGELTDLLDLPAWDLELQAERLALANGATPVELRALTVATVGNLQGYRVEMASQLALGAQEPLELTLSGAGDRAGLAVEFARADHAAGSLTADGRLDWSDGPRVSAAATIDRLDPSLWIGAWPAAHPLTGVLAMEWAGARVRISEFRLAATGTPLEIDGRAEVATGDNEVSGRIRWRGFAWPVGAGKPELTSRSGQLTLSGRPDRWTAEGQVRLEAAGLPEGEVRISANGDREGARVEIGHGAVLDGNFAGTLDYRWAEPAEWTARITAASLRTGALVPDYPGTVSGRVVARGRPSSDEIDIRIEALDGTLRGRRFEANGRLVIAGGVPRAEALSARSGDSEIWVDGSPLKPEGLAFRVHVASLADLLGDASGRIDAKGNLRLATATHGPRIELDLEAAELAWNDWRAASVTVRPNGLPGAAGGHRVAIEDARIPGYEVESLSVSLSGQEPLQRIRAEARIAGTLFTTLLEGGVADWQRPLGAGWRGRIEELRADHETLGFLELQEPAALSGSATELRLDTLCLRGLRNGTVCVDIDWGSRDGLAVDAGFDDISLEALRLLAATEIVFTQRLTGTVEWRRPAFGDPTAAVDIGISAGEMILPDGQAALETGPGILGFTLQDGRLQAGNFDLPITGAGSIDTDFNVSDVFRGGDAPLDARIRIELSDLGPIARILPALDVVEGRVSADLRIGGTVSDPALTGHATLVRGRIEHYATGLVLSDVQLAGAVYEYDYTELHGTFRAGGGQGRIKASLGFHDLMKPQVTLELTGTDLVLINVPDLRLTADPDLRLLWDGGTLGIDGRVLVSDARLSPRYLPTATVVESPDLVFVGGDATEPASPAPETPDLKLAGSVEVVLGEDVSVTLERATAEIGGSVKFLWDDQLMPIGDGTFTVTGEIRAYGQLLSISEGRISFPRRPADNPSLDIRAEREIYGNPQIKTAGVHITGTVRRPLLEPYSEPMTTRERALTLLITGRDFDYEQGTGGIAVGTYVAPRLYVSYGIGLFGDQNVITARYDLKGGLGIKATSGQRETGVDISYTIED